MIPVFETSKRGTDELLRQRLRLSTAGDARKFENQVSAIIDRVKSGGDRALCLAIARFEKRRVKAKQLFLSSAQIQRLLKQVDAQVAATLRRVADSIRRYHEVQKRQAAKSFRLNGRKGSFCEQRVRPLNRVAVYAPGGKAFYPSTVLMNAIPARVAGVKEIILVTPSPHPAVVYAARLAGIKKILVCGGAHAIAAVAYGTKSIPQVDKIVGPGNRFVAVAKKLVFGAVDIDMIAGPSEVMIVAEGKQEPSWIAWDLLAQAEHDEEARPLLVTSSKTLAVQVKKHLTSEIDTLPRRAIARESCARKGAIIVTRNLSEAARWVDEVAPEHLEILCKKPEQFLKRVRNYGAAFLGPLTPEVVGDYVAGPSHVLPTAGTARFASPLGIDDFLKRSSVIKYTKEALAEVLTDGCRLAAVEGLDAHGCSLAVRFGRN